MDDPEEMDISEGLALLQNNFWISDRKKAFFNELYRQLPNDRPCIQSSDGEFVDVLWEEEEEEDIIVSITDIDTISVGDIMQVNPVQYFEDCQAAIPFIVTRRS
jgi:hypothetical protein